MLGRMSSLRCLLCLALVLGACSSEPPHRPPNIIVFVLDTVRADAIVLAEDGLSVTPNIRYIAGQGTYFDNAFTHTTWTKPAVATLFTSMFPSQHTVRNITVADDGKLFSERLPEEIDTLAERLQAGGYRTWAILNQQHLQSRYGFGQGFDEYFAFAGKNYRHLNGVLQAWISGLVPDASEPFFLYMHYLDPHWPYENVVRGLKKRMGPLELEPEPPRSGEWVDEWMADGLSEAQVGVLRTRYLHGVAVTDRAMGLAIQMLDKAGMMENTVTLVTSDHGEGFLEHGKLLHGYAPYEEVQRVPLVIRLPESFEVSVRRSTALVGLVDIMPTLLDIAGLPAGDLTMGRSLLPLMRRQDVGRSRPVFNETEGTYSLRTETHKIIRRPEGEPEYYDLIADPLEQSSLPCDSACQELDAQLATLVAALAPPSDVSAEGVELEAEDLERLRALGYLND